MLYVYTHTYICVYLCTHTHTRVYVRINGHLEIGPSNFYECYKLYYIILFLTKNSTIPSLVAVQPPL